MFNCNIMCLTVWCAFCCNLQMTSRQNRSKRGRFPGSSSGQAPVPEAPQFDSARFLSAEHQEWFGRLCGRKILPEKIFDLKPNGEYRQFMENMHHRRWDILLQPITRINVDIVREFYANAMPTEDAKYVRKTVVRGRVISFNRAAISSYLGDPLALPENGCEYARIHRARQWNMDEVAETLSFESRGFSLNPSGIPVKMDRGNMNQMAQLHLTLLLNNLKPKSHNSDLTLANSCLLFAMMTGIEIDIAQIISEEMREVASSGHSLGSRLAGQLPYPALIMGLCRRARVEIPDEVHMTITSKVDDSYVARFCSPRARGRCQPQPEAVAPPAGQARYNQQMACRYSWDYMDALRRSEATIHDSLHRLYLKMSDPSSVTSFTTNEQYEAICNYPEDRPFFRNGGGEDEENEEEGEEGNHEEEDNGDE